MKQSYFIPSSLFRRHSNPATLIIRSVITSLLALAPFPSAKPIFCEDFKAADAYIPVTSDYLTVASTLSLERHGEEAGEYKFSHRPEIKHDPHDVWNDQPEGIRER